MLELSFTMWVLPIVCAVMIGMAKTGVNAPGTLAVPLKAYIFGGMQSSGLGLA